MAPPIASGTTPAAPTSDAEFAAQFAAKLDADESGDAGESDAASTGDDESSGESEQAEHDEGDGSRAAADDAEHDDDEGDGEEESDADDSGDDAKDAGEKAGGESEGTDDDDGESSGDATGDATGDDGAAEDKPDEKASAAVQKALEKAGLKLTLKDIPLEARPLVQKKLDHAQAAITRAMQEATQFRKEKNSFLAEQKFREEHPELAIAELLDAKPDLIEKVQEHLDKLTDPDKKRLFANDLKEARQKSFDAIQSVQVDYERRMQRADQMEAYVHRACEKLDLPVPVVEQAIALELLNKPEAQRDLTEQELDRVITRQAQVLKRVSRERNLTERQQQIRDRQKDKRTSTPAVRAGSGVASPRPGGKPKPKNDAEFTNYMLNKL